MLVVETIGRIRREHGVKGKPIRRIRGAKLHAETQSQFAEEARTARKPVDFADDADLAPLDAAMAFVALEVRVTV